MTKARSPNRDKALELWLESGGNISNRELADQLGEKEKTISNWKSRDKWNVVLQSGQCSTTMKSESNAGAPERNKNAVGNRGGAAPKRNSNAVSHGFFRKYFPDDVAEIMEEIESKSPLNMLWENIMIQYTAIIRAQRIMFVEDKEEMIKEIKKRKYEIVDTSTKEKASFEQVVTEEEYEFQFSWDRHATFLNAQSRAMATLQSLIKRYEDMLNSHLATEEQRLRIEKLKIEVKELNGENDSDAHHRIVDTNQL
ncbi:phage terminase small subunit [Brevibacillus laterosporus]|uniref:phage terminase small subunit n=1 Tax=Brevibacillus laterosporus TaxID=1465 RepID=UPI000839CACE|nr:phage terminase small subunit [Brevibacillus laterosporus]